MKYSRVTNFMKQFAVLLHYERMGEAETTPRPNFIKLEQVLAKRPRAVGKNQKAKDHKS